MNTTINEVIFDIENNIKPAVGDKSKSLDIALDVLKERANTISEYEKLMESLDEENPIKISQAIDDFCINTMRKFLCDFYSKKLAELWKREQFKMTKPENPTIDNAIEVMKYLKTQNSQLQSLDVAIDIMEKYQRIQNLIDEFRGPDNRKLYMIGNPAYCNENIEVLMKIIGILDDELLELIKGEIINEYVW